MVVDSHQLPSDTNHDKIVKNCEAITAMLLKQGKQIHVLYGLQKETNEKVTWIQNQMKTQNDKKKNVDLSEKVFSVSKTFQISSYSAIFST